MPSRGQSLTLGFTVWDTVNQVGKTGDLANLTLRWLKDGVETTPANSPAEVDATNMPGSYKITLTSSECTCDSGTLGGKSATTGIVVIPMTVTFEQLPTVAPAASGGLPTCDGSNNVGITQAGADKAWSSASRSLTDKANFTLTSAYDPAKTAAQAGDAMALTSGERTTLTGVIWAALTSGLTVANSIGKALVDFLTAYTTPRAVFLDNLNIGGNVASSTEVTSIQNNTRCVRSVPSQIERPDAGTQTYRIELLLYDAVGNMEAPDSAPTITLVNQSGTDLSSRLASTTMALVSTGRYRAVYTASVTDDLEQLNWTFSVIEGGATRLYPNTSLIVDTTAVDFTAADRTKLEAVYGKLPSKSYLTGTGNADGDIQADEATGNFPGSVASVVDRTGYSLSNAGIQAVYDFATALLTVSGSIGKLFVDMLNAAVGTRLATSDYEAETTAQDSVLVNIKEQVDKLTFTPLTEGNAVQANVVLTVGKELPSGVVVDDPGNTRYTFQTDLTEAEANSLQDLMLWFVDGTLDEQIKRIDSSDGNGRVALSSGFSSTPAPGASFYLINR